MIGIVNYGSGNIQAISNVYRRLSIPFTVLSTPADLASVERIILPGVGAFDQTMGELRRSGLLDALNDVVLKAQTPILGICVGMQVLAESSEEGVLPGLAWIPGTVRRFEQTSTPPQLQLPHMGWNSVAPTGTDPLFEGIDPEFGFYFLHSYYFSASSSADVLATTSYGAHFSCAVRRGNIWGVQFHPEKSHANGIRLLQNFARS